MTRILVVDDHPVVCTGLVSMLSMEPTLDIVGSCASGEEALEQVQAERVDLMLLDLRMPGMSGIDTLRSIKSRGIATRCIILTSFDTDEDIFRAVEAGADGFLRKDTSLKDMREAIQLVCLGQRYLPAQIAGRLADRMMRTNLTAREHEILQLLPKGLTNKQIGTALGISENTARNHVNSIIEKLEVCDRTEATTIAIQRGLIIPQ